MPAWFTFRRRTEPERRGAGGCETENEVPVVPVTTKCVETRVQSLKDTVAFIYLTPDTSGSSDLQLGGHVAFYFFYQMFSKMASYSIDDFISM